MSLVTSAAVVSAASALTSTLVPFMSAMQRSAVLRVLRGEEGEGMAERINALVAIIEGMPHTYQTDGQGMDAVVHLHYFGGPYDGWITEKDMGDGSADKSQHQAFGMACFSGVGEPELGYISIAELIANDIELDLYWTPKPLKELHMGH